jgi:O-antigen/teichoic acid export membrane protein
VPLTTAVSFSREILGQVRQARLRRRGFLPNVMVVMTGTGLAQALTVCLAPVLSRLYGPGEFGQYGSFLSVAAVLSAGLTLQYSEALMLPDKDEEAASLFWAGSCSAVALGFVFTLSALLLPSWWLSLVRAPALAGWLWLIPLAALFAGLKQNLSAWCARRKTFRPSAAAQVARSVTVNSAQTTAGALGWGTGGLIGGAMLGDLLAGLGLLFWVGRHDGALLRAGARRQQALAAARAHKDFAFYSTPQNVMNAVSQGAPVILLIHYFGVATGGLYALAIRVLELPMNFILGSLRQVLFQKLSEVHNDGGDLRRLFRKTTALLLGLSLAPAAIGFVLAPWAFALVFGQRWAVAGEYARWLLIWLVPGFCNLPAALAGRILRQQRNLFLFDLGLLAARIGVLVLGGRYLAPGQTVVAFSVVGGVFNVALILFVWRLLQLREAARARSAFVI